MLLLKRMALNKTNFNMKRIVIMGATSGIGLRVAVKFALRGYKVGVAGRNTKVLEAFKKRFPENVEYETVDITRADAPAKLNALIDKLGGMDTYFHASGIGYSNPLLVPAAETATIKTNVEGFTRMIDAAYAYFRDNGIHGHIAAISSVAGTRGIGQLAAYSSAKKYNQAYLEALDQLARSQKLDIKFTDLRPGWISTPLISRDIKYPCTMTTAYAANRIIESLDAPWRVNYIDWRWALISGIMKLVPPCLWVRLDIPIKNMATPRE